MDIFEDRSVSLPSRLDGPFNSIFDEANVMFHSSPVPTAMPIPVDIQLELAREKTRQKEQETRHKELELEILKVQSGYSKVGRKDQELIKFLKYVPKYEESPNIDDYIIQFETAAKDFSFPEDKMAVLIRSALTKWESA